MYKKLADDQLHPESEWNMYGNWYCTRNQDGTLTLRGDSDSSKLPTNIPAGSTAVSTTGDAYFFNTNSWDHI